MKTPLGIAALCLGFSSAHAVLIYEPFDYAAGLDLTGQTPPGATTGWQVMGTGGTGGTDPITIASGSLSGVAGLAPASGNSITFGGLGLTNRIPLGAAFTTGSLYYSFAFKVTDLGGLNATGGFMAGFNNSTGSVANQPTLIAARLVTRVSGTGFQVGVDKSSGQGASFVFADTIFNLDETIFVVGSYTFNSGSTTDDEARLWVNPSPSTFGLESAPAGFLSSVATNDLTPLASFLFRQGNAAAVPGVVVADELRIDTTWAGVTAPEPSGIALLTIAGIGVLTRRIRGKV
jgi:hypothetical protein